MENIKTSTLNLENEINYLAELFQDGHLISSTNPKEFLEIVTEEIKALRHILTTHTGLFATDKPELIPKELLKFFFEL